MRSVGSTRWRRAVVRRHTEKSPSRTRRSGAPPPHKCLSGSTHCESYRQGLRAADEGRRGTARVAGKLDRVDAGEQFLEEHPHLESRQMLAEAQMSPVAEGDVARGVAVDPKAIRLLESSLIAVA